MITERNFIIGIGAGLLIASTLALVGYLSVISDKGTAPDAGAAASLTLSEELSRNEAYENIIETLEKEAALRQEEVAALKGDVEKLVQEITEISEENKKLEENAKLAAAKEQETAAEGEDTVVVRVTEESTAAQSQPPQVQAQAQPRPQTQPQPQPQTQAQPQPQSQPQAQAAQPQPQPKPQAAAAQQPQPQPTPPAAAAPAQEQNPQNAQIEQNGGKVSVTIPSGSTNQEIADAMSSMGLVGNKAEFSEYLDRNSLYIQYQPGTYEFEKGTSYDEIIENIMK